jgi:hypothetical protein
MNQRVRYEKLVRGKQYRTGNESSAHRLFSMLLVIPLKSHRAVVDTRYTLVEDAGWGRHKKASAKAGLVIVADSRDINTRGEYAHLPYAKAMKLPELDVIRDTDTASTKIPVLLAFSVIDPDRRLHFPLNQRIFLGLVFRHDVQYAACRYECLHFISPYPSSRVYHS